MNLQAITMNDLAKIIDLSGKPINKFFNTSGVVYREMKLKDNESNDSAYIHLNKSSKTKKINQLICQLKNIQKYVFI